MTWVETWVLSPVGPAFAKPKSESLALNSESSRMLDALKSRYMTWFSASCRKDKPLAAPRREVAGAAEEAGEVATSAQATAYITCLP